MPEITISSDGLQAVVATVGPRTTAEEIIVALNEAGVTDGMQTSAIVGAIAEVKETGSRFPTWSSLRALLRDSKSLPRSYISPGERRKISPRSKTSINCSVWKGPKRF